MYNVHISSLPQLTEYLAICADAKSQCVQRSLCVLVCAAETTVLANDLKHEGFTVVSLDPGDVSTGMWRYLTEEVFTETSPFAKRQPSLTPQESVKAMLKLTLDLNVEHTGKFILYDKTNLPW